MSRRVSDRINPDRVPRIIVAAAAALLAIQTYAMCRHDEEARIIREAEAQPVEGVQIHCKRGGSLIDCRVTGEDRLRKCNVERDVGQKCQSRLGLCSGSLARATRPEPAWKLVAKGFIAGAVVIGAFVAGAWLL